MSDQGQEPARRDLSGHVVLLAGVTGALGGEFARYVLQCGGKVAATVRREWQVEKVRAALFTDGATDHLLVGTVGAADSEAAAGFVKGANDALGPITAMVSAAGLFRSAEVGREPAGELQQLLEANLIAGASLARAVLPTMRRRDFGSLIFVGSAGVGGGIALSANYLASKAAVHEYVRALDLLLRGSGVHACAIVPATLDTEDNRAAMPDADRSAWVSIDRAVEALAVCAFDPAGPAASSGLVGALFPLPGNA